jgi:hypothetical protein
MSFKEFIKGKRIVIVGPAPHNIGKRLGEKFDSYDLIVRFNQALPYPQHLSEDLGSRTDILYNCLNTDCQCGGPYLLNDWKQHGVKWVASPYPEIPPFDVDINKFKRVNNNKFNFHIIDKTKYMKFAEEIKSRPNTGTSSIIDLLSYDIKELMVTGITFFYKTAYYKEYKAKSLDNVLDEINKYNNHKRRPQLDYIKKLFEKDDRFNIDDELIEIFNNINDIEKGI